MKLYIALILDDENVNDNVGAEVEFEQRFLQWTAGKISDKFVVPMLAKILETFEPPLPEDREERMRTRNLGVKRSVKAYREKQCRANPALN